MITSGKRQCHRTLEQNWRRNKSSKYRYLAIYHQCHLLSNMQDNAEKKDYRSSLHEHKFEFKQVFHMCNGLLGRDKDLPLHPCDINQVLADWFNTFFTTKIKKVGNDLIDSNCDLINQGITEPTELCMANSNVAFSNLKRLEEKEIIKTLRAAPSKTFGFDPVATMLLKDILPKVVPLMEAIINKYLNTGTFDDSLKEVLVCSLLKMINLNFLGQKLSSSLKSELSV